MQVFSEGKQYGRIIKVKRSSVILGPVISIKTGVIETGNPGTEVTEARSSKGRGLRVPKIIIIDRAK